MAEGSDSGRGNAPQAGLEETRFLGDDALPAQSCDFELKSPEPDVQAEPKLPLLGEYLLLGPLGTGGMGQVFKANHRRMDRLVALKLLKPTLFRDEAAINRFQREMRAAAKLFHPNIVTAFDAGEQNGVHYLVMEYVQGQSLSQLVQQHGPLAPSKAAKCILQVAKGLEYAHSRAIIHRDIKPGNLMLGEDGAVKILDMGIARLHESSGASELTEAGAVMGSVAYMAPEQAKDSSAVDQRADIYSLGCTSYYLLTGSPPYVGGAVETMIAHATQPIPSARAVRPDVPQRLDQIVQRMLAKQPDDRYQTMGELIADLEGGGPVVAAPDSAASVLASHVLAPSGAPAGQDGASTIIKMLAVGVDLGSDYSIVASVDRKGMPTTAPGPDGQPKTPSIVLIEGSAIRIGQRALASSGKPSNRAAVDIKGALGKKHFPQLLDGKTYPPEVLLALLLAQLAEDARRSIGNFRHVALSVPSCFDDLRRKSIRDVGYMAGLEVLGLVNEPIAVALFFARQQKLLDATRKLQGKACFLIVGLGAGAFTASVVKCEQGSLSTLATEGEATLGARDFDERLAQWVRKELASKHKIQLASDARTLAMLTRRCATVRQTLSTEDSTRLVLELKGQSVSLEINRTQFASLVGELLKRIRSALATVMKVAGRQQVAVTHVLAFGGGTRMPSVAEAITEIAGRGLPVTMLLDDAVAQGTALFAALQVAARQGKEPWAKIHDISFHSVGVVGADPKTRKPANIIVMRRNAPLPSMAKGTFTTPKSDQDSFSITILQGENPSPQQCALIGKCVIEDLPSSLPPGTPINVEFHYSASAELSMHVEAPAIGYRATQDISRESGLTNVELQRWREWVETATLCNDFF